jgi:hypothetical protein
MDDVMHSTVSLFELVWPYRPDLLIRIDFLDWYHEVEARYFPRRVDGLTPVEVITNQPFFAAAMQHPYFLQYTRKERYRRKNLSKQDAEGVYSEGIAAFITLMRHIQQHGFDEQQKIGLKCALFLRRPYYTPPPWSTVRRRYYIGDGCHRLACLAWLGKTGHFPANWFAIEYRLVLRPLNWFGILENLGILESGDEQRLFELWRRNNTICDWTQLIGWTRVVRQRFQQQDIDALFAIKFTY